MADAGLFARRVLVMVSLGNPAPYANTMHSVGHHALQSLQELLAPEQPPFTNTQDFGRPCRHSLSQQYIMLQCPTAMNVSGQFVKKAWESAVKTVQKPTKLDLLIVHDDMELKFGVVKFREWGASARGHNGVKSILSKLHHADYPESNWARLSIGIGRPDTRERLAVSDYVLGPITHDQMITLDRHTGKAMVTELRLWKERLERER